MTDYQRRLSLLKEGLINVTVSTEWFKKYHTNTDGLEALILIVKDQRRDTKLFKGLE